MYHVGFSPSIEQCFSRALVMGRQEVMYHVTFSPSIGQCFPRALVMGRQGVMYHVGYSPSIGQCFPRALVMGWKGIIMEHLRYHLHVLVAGRSQVISIVPVFDLVHGSQRMEKTTITFARRQATHIYGRCDLCFVGHWRGANGALHNGRSQEEEARSSVGIPHW